MTQHLTWCYANGLKPTVSVVRFEYYCVYCDKLVIGFKNEKFDYKKYRFCIEEEAKIHHENFCSGAVDLGVVKPVRFIRI